MSRLPEPRMREDFRRELRGRLMAEAQTMLVARRGTAWTFQRLLRPALAFAVVAALLAGGAGTAAAASVAGDPAFALKRVAEELRLTFAFDDVSKVQLLSQIADHRLAELQEVAENEGKAPAASQQYADAVARFRAAVAALQQAAPRDKRDAAQDVAESAREKHVAILDDLQERVPESARPEIERALEEQERDTPEEAKDATRTPRPERTAPPSRSPRPTERPTERSETPRPTVSPRVSPTADHD